MLKQQPQIVNWCSWIYYSNRNNQIGGWLEVTETLCSVRISLLSGFKKITMCGSDAKIRLEADEGHINLYSKIGGPNR